MGIMAWDHGAGFSSLPRVRNPRLTVPDTPLEPTEVTFGLSPSHGHLTAREAHDWFLEMMHEHEEFEVMTDRAGESPLSFWAFCRRVSLWQNQRSLGPKGRVTWGTSRVSR